MPLHILFDLYFLEAAQKYGPRNLEQMTPVLRFHFRQERTCTKKKKKKSFNIQNIAINESEASATYALRFGRNVFVHFHSFGTPTFACETFGGFLPRALPRLRGCAEEKINKRFMHNLVRTANERLLCTTMHI